MSSVSGWTEAVLFSLLFVTILTIITVNFNGMYGKNNAVPFSDSSGSQNLFIKYQDTAQTQIKGGEADFDAQQGITLKSSWGLAKDAVSISWGFISGGWIEQIITSMNLGESGTALAVALRILFFLSLVFAILYALFKVAL